MTEKKLKIAIYSHSIAPSIDGVCRRITGLIHEMVQQGHAITLFTMEEHPEELPDDIEVISLDYMIFPSYPGKKVAKPTFRSVFKVMNALRANRPDIIHVVADGFSHIFTIAGLVLNIPVLGSFHTDLIDLLNTHNALWFQKFLVVFKEAIDSLVLDSCATTSKSFSAKLLKQGVKCEHIIITAVDVDKFSKNKRNIAIRKELMFGDVNGFLCVYVGRISNEKRIDVILKAVEGLTGAPNAYIALIGDGPSAQVYAQLHGKEKRIYCKPRFLSHDELAEMYASSDLHVSASQFETLGNTVLESFSCNIPVVVPDTQGFQDTVHHGVDGYLFKPGNADDAQKYMQLLKDDVNLRTKMGAQARDNVNNRTVAFVVKDLLEWYKLGAQKRGKRSRLNAVLCCVLLTGTTLFGIVAFFTYDILVNSLLKSFISYSGGDGTVKRKVL